MRGFFSSLFGRLVLLLLSVLVVTQLFSALLHLSDRSSLLYRAVQTDAAQRMGALTHVLDGLEPAERARLVAALDRPPTRMRLEPRWRSAAAGAGERNYNAALFESILRPQVPEGRRFRVTMSDEKLLQLHLHDDSPGGATTDHEQDAGTYLPGREFEVEIALADGSAVHFFHQVPTDALNWPFRLFAVLSLLLVAVIVVSIIAARWLTKPLAELATAATELGHNIARRPLEIRGPLEVRRAAQAFNAMQARLTHYVEDRSRFLAAVSHDLRTPITRLKLQLELLGDPSLQAKLQPEVEEMEAMMSATLEYVQGTTVTEETALVDINALLEGLESDYQEQSLQVDVHGTARHPIQARPLSLKRCLRNLFDNGVKYGKRARVEVKDGEDALTISITDEGPGIPEAELEHVFEPFFRLESSRNPQYGGTGLGLSIARNIAQAHGGELTLKNSDAGGLEATLLLPR